MKHLRFSVFLAATAAVTGGFVILACDTDNGSTSGGALPTADSGGKKDGTGGEDEDTDGGGSTKNDSGKPSNDASVSADCSTAPFVPTRTDGFYCSFFPSDGGIHQGTDAYDGGGPYCYNDETCCNAPDNADGTHNLVWCAAGKATDATEAFCISKLPASGGYAWPTGANAKYPGTSWGCLNSGNCGSGEVCCLTTEADAGASNQVDIGPDQNSSIPKACGAQQSFREGGSVCRSGNSCQTGEIKLCQSDTDCAAPTKCKPFEAFYHRYAGHCE